MSRRAYRLPRFASKADLEAILDKALASARARDEEYRRNTPVVWSNSRQVFYGDRSGKCIHDVDREQGRCRECDAAATKAAETYFNSHA